MSENIEWGDALNTIAISSHNSRNHVWAKMGLDGSEIGYGDTLYMLDFIEKFSSDARAINALWAKTTASLSIHVLSALLALPLSELLNGVKLGKVLNSSAMTKEMMKSFCARLSEETDFDAELRGNAVREIAQMSNLSYVHLTLLLSNDPVVRESAMQSCNFTFIESRLIDPCQVAEFVERWGVEEAPRNKILCLAGVSSTVLLNAAADSDPSVRLYVAKNPTTPLFCLRALLCDEDSAVRTRAQEALGATTLGHRAQTTTSEEGMYELLATNIPAVLANLAKNKNLPFDILKTLVTHKVKRVARVAYLDYTITLSEKEERELGEVVRQHKELIAQSRRKANQAQQKL